MKTSARRTLREAQEAIDYLTTEFSVVLAASVEDVEYGYGTEAAAPLEGLFGVERDAGWIATTPLAEQFARSIVTHLLSNDDVFLDYRGAERIEAEVRS